MMKTEQRAKWRTVRRQLVASEDLRENAGVRYDDDYEWQSVHHDHAKHSVRQLVHLRGEHVERYALLVPRDVRVALHVEDHHLQHIPSSASRSATWRCSVPHYLSRQAGKFRINI